MKVLLAVAALALAVLVWMPMDQAAAADDVTLKGEPVDISCYLKGQSGEGHATCAKSCVSKGKPVGFAVKDGDKSTLYLVIGASTPAKDLLGDHMGKQVEVTGKVSKTGGMNIITVSKVGS